MAATGLGLLIIGIILALGGIDGIAELFGEKKVDKVKPIVQDSLEARAHKAKLELKRARRKARNEAKK